MGVLSDDVATHATKVKAKHPKGWEPGFEWDGRRWDSDDIAEPRVIEAVRAFIDETERDYRAAQAEAEGTFFIALPFHCAVGTKG